MNELLKNSKISRFLKFDHSNTILEEIDPNFFKGCTKDKDYIEPKIKYIKDMNQRNSDKDFISEFGFILEGDEAGSENSLVFEYYIRKQDVKKMSQSDLKKYTSWVK